MFAELYLTDGTIKIDLLGANRHGFGIGLNRMTLSRAQRVPSGAFRQVYGAVNETYELKIIDHGHDAVTARQQQLDRLLEQARNYFESNAENNIIWLTARTADETNARYAIVYGGVIESYDDVYQQPFVGGPVSTINEIVLVVERSTWQANPPANPECVILTNAVEWNPNVATWSNVRTLTDVQTLFTTDAGSVLAASSNIERSTDSGGSWAVELNTGAATIRFWQFLQIGSGRIWAVAGAVTGAAVAASGIYYSDNDGDTWSQHTASVDFYSVVYRGADDTLFFGGDGEIRYIQAGGALTPLSTLQTGDVRAMALTDDSSIVIGDEYDTWLIPAVTFAVEETISEDTGAFLQAINMGDYLLMTSANHISISRDNGETWSIYWREWGTNAIYLLDNGYLVASQNGTDDIFISTDGGFGWLALATLTADDPIRSFTELGDTYLFAGANDTVHRRIATDADIAYGPFEADCLTPVYVANHRLESNWTHIKIYDSSINSYTTILPSDVVTLLENDTDQLVFPSPVGVNDVFYVGISTALTDAGAFSNLFIELTERNYTLTVAVEYWDSAAWTALTTSDMQDNTQSLHRTGILAWHLDDTVAMTAVAVNGITAYWIRIRVTATGSLSTLIPKFRNVYIVQQPFIELDNLAGDIPAIAKLTLNNRLDVDEEPLLSQPTIRTIIGLRTVSRGERFTAFLNLAQTQNPPGVTVTALGTETAFITDDTIAAAGEFIRYTPVTLNLWGPIASIRLDTELAHHFAGTFQVYLRYAYYDAADIVSLRVAVESFAFGIQTVGDEVPLTLDGIQTDYARLAYMGQFTIAPDRYMSGNDIGQQTRIVIDAKTTTAGASYATDIFDLILIPADEWTGDFFDGDTFGSAASGLQTYVDIDSATFPKRILRSMIRKNGSDLVSGVWQSSASGAFILQPGEKQRLWFLAESYNTEQVYRASPHTLVHQVKLWHHSRWLGLRGND